MHATINGKEYPLEFAGYDRASYQHTDGCLHKADPRMPCQCGAADRADRWYQVKLPASALGEEVKP